MGQKPKASSLHPFCLAFAPPPLLIRPSIASTLHPSRSPCRCERSVARGPASASIERGSAITNTPCQDDTQWCLFSSVPKPPDLEGPGVWYIYIWCICQTPFQTTTMGLVHDTWNWYICHPRKTPENQTPLSVCQCASPKDVVSGDHTSHFTHLIPTHDDSGRPKHGDKVPIDVHTFQPIPRTHEQFLVRGCH